MAEIEVKSHLIFNGYSVTHMEFRRNSQFDITKEVEVNFNFDGSAQINEELDMAKLHINCKIFEEEFYKREAPFYLDIGLEGRFELMPLEDMNIENFQLNGLAILIPHLRAIITSFTSQTGMPPVILPPINVYNAFEIIESNK